MEPYVISGGKPGRDRLAVLSRILGPSTAAFLGRIGTRPGMRCLDVGCGGGDVTQELARRVGPTGQVIGIDRDAVIIQLAKREAEQAGLQQIEYRVGDACVCPAERAFDAVYARFLLSHLPRVQDGLSALWQATRPGGVLAVEDIDFTGHVCHPPCPAFDRYVVLYREVVHRRGGDADIGLKLPGMLANLGAEAVEVQTVQPVGLRGELKSLSSLTLENIAGAVTAEGLATAAEVAGLLDELRSAERNPRILLSLPRVFQVWGRRLA